MIHDPFVPDAVAAEETNEAGTPASVGAVILGAEPKALVEVSGRSELVGIGSSLAGGTVVSITRNGILLDDGVRLPFLAGRP